MKLRIKGNTVRYRLSKTEVADLIRNGELEEQSAFLSGMFRYAVKQTNKETLSADFTQNKITLYVPQQALQQWATTDQVGINYLMPLPNAGSLYLLLEKDFKCIDAEVTEDQSDNFENPHFTC